MPDTHVATGFRRLEITLACQGACLFCSRHDGKGGKHFPPEWIIEQARSLPDLAHTTILISGGEPSLHPELPLIIQRLAALGPQGVLLETNGQFPPARLTEWQAAGLTGVAVLLPSHLGAVYDRITGSPGGLSQAAAVLRAASASMEAWASLPVCQWNAPALPETLRRLAKVAPQMRGFLWHGLSPSEAPERRFLLDGNGESAAFAKAVEAAATIGLPLLKMPLERPQRPSEAGDASLFDVGGQITEAILRVNYRCNEKCDWCWVPHERPDIPLPAILAEARRIHRLGTRYATLSGGEPTLRRDIPEILARLREMGFTRLGLQTNAVRCAKEGYVQALVAAGLDEAFVSLHGSRPEIADAVTELPGGHGKTVAGLHALLKEGVDIRINLVIDGRNAEDLPEFVAFCHREFGGYEAPCVLIFSFAHPISSRSERGHMVPFSQAAPHLRRALDRCLELGMPFAGLEAQCGVPPCILGGEWQYYPRRSGEQGQSHDRDFMFLEGCADCAGRPYCQGIRKGYAESFGTEEFTPLVTTSDR